MEGQYTCQHRAVADDGRLVCSKIPRGDREVSATLCAACPAARCNCVHLRFSLEKDGGGAIIIRYGNGRSAVWDDRPPALRFARAACAVRLAPLCSAADCTGCPQRTPAIAQEVCAASPAAAQADLAAIWPRAASVGKVIAFPGAVSRRQLAGS